MKCVKTETVFNRIMASDLFRLNGDKIDLCEELLALVKAVNEEESLDEFIFDMGEGGECCLGDLIVGAFWAFQEWHGGQDSKEYAVMCELGSIFNPGMANGPEEDSPEETAYEQINQWFEERQ